MAFMAVQRNRKKNQTKKNFDEIFKKFDRNQNQRVSVKEFTEAGKLSFKGITKHPNLSKPSVFLDMSKRFL